jgi:hypothetical protein
MKKWLICLLLSFSFSSHASDWDDRLTDEEALQVIKNGRLIASGQYLLVEDAYASLFLVNYIPFYCLFENAAGMTLFKCRQHLMMNLGK